MNSLACLLLGPVAGLAADVAGTWSVADRSEADVRRVIPGPDTTRTSAVDLQTTPQTGLQLNWPGFDVALGYGLSIAEVDVTNPDRRDDQKTPVINHSAQVGVGWAPQPDLHFTLAVSGAYGRRNYLALNPNLTFQAMTPTPGAGGAQPPPPAPTQPPATNYTPLTDRIIGVGALRVALGVAYRFDTQWTGHAAAGYEISGGASDQDQEFVPRQRGPNAAVGLTYAISLSDELSTTVAASDISVTTLLFRVPAAGAEYQTLNVTETWGHKWSEQTSGSLGGGITSQRNRPRYGYTWGTSSLPNANASITHQVSLEKESRLTFNGATGIGTGYNAVTGQILYGLSAATTMAWTYERFAVAAGLSGGQSLHLRQSDPDTSRNVSGSLTFTYTPVQLVDLQLGARESWQIVPNSAVGAPPPQWVVFLGIGLRLPPIAF